MVRRRYNCEDVENRLPPFIFGKLPKRELDKFLNHLWKCDNCFESYRLQDRIYQIYHPEENERNRRIWGRISKKLEDYFKQQNA